MGEHEELRDDANAPWNPTKEIVVIRDAAELAGLRLTPTSMIPAYGRVIAPASSQVIVQLIEQGRSEDDWTWPYMPHTLLADWVPHWMQEAEVRFVVLRSEETNRLVLWGFRKAVLPEDTEALLLSALRIYANTATPVE